MSTESTVFGRFGQPHSVENVWYRIRMPAPNTRKQLWENVSVLMLRHYGGENLTRLAKEAKFGPGSATRLKEQKTSVGVDIVDKLAKHFKLAPWQLLAPGLEPEKPPQFAPPSDHWPFPDIDRSRFNGLSLRQQIEIQGVVRERMERFEGDAGKLCKGNGTSG